MVPSINLIPVARRDAQDRRRRIRTWIATCAVYAGVVGAGSVWSLLTLVDRGERERADLKELVARVEQLEKDREVRQGEMAETAATLQANLVITQEPDWSLLLALTADALGDDAVLAGFRLMPGAAAEDAAADAGGYVLMLTGTCLSQEGVSAFVLRLEELGLFDKVTLLESRRQAYRDRELVAFDLRCDFGTRGSS